jgi:hypothetical protein
MESSISTFIATLGLIFDLVGAVIVTAYDYNPIRSTFLKILYIYGAKDINLNKVDRALAGLSQGYDLHPDSDEFNHLMQFMIKKNRVNERELPLLENEVLKSEGGELYMEKESMSEPLPFDDVYTLEQFFESDIKDMFLKNGMLMFVVGFGLQIISNVLSAI